MVIGSSHRPPYSLVAPRLPWRSAARVGAIVPLLLFPAGEPTRAQELYEVPEGVATRWFSFENPGGRPGSGGQANEGRKGAATREVSPGDTVVLADVPGPGVVRRIWLTVPGEPEILRGFVFRIYWDGQDWPSVEAPLQDFFGLPFARQVPFQSALFSNPEGRSFNCVVPMPFAERARIEIVNESPRKASLYYDVDATLGDRLPARLGYLHARYRRENPTVPGRDFEVLPRVESRGRYLGANVGVRSARHRRPFWFGEGELKIYLDDDRDLPTLVGTGTEDLVGSAWGLGLFDHLYQGCPLTEERDGVWGFYRYHVPDPVYFEKAIRVTLQQIAGGTVGQLRALSLEDRPELVRTHRRFDPATHDAPEDSWENFEALQDICATAYWYQTLPSPRWPPLEPYAERLRDLGVARVERE